MMADSAATQRAAIQARARAKLAEHGLNAQQLQTSMPDNYDAESWLHRIYARLWWTNLWLFFVALPMVLTVLMLLVVTLTMIGLASVGSQLRDQPPAATATP